MEYEKKDWQRSDGRYRSFGKNSREKERRLSAYHPAEWENTKERRPNEMMTMESSYGGIAFGASRCGKMTLVAYEKRSINGPTLKKDNQEIEGNRTVKINELRGNFRTNSHSRQDSALVYEEDLQESFIHIKERLQEMMDESSPRSAKKTFPFLNRKEDKEKRKEIQEQLRISQENGDKAGYEFWSTYQEHFQQEFTEKEQMRLNFYRELMFAKEKAKKMVMDDAPLAVSLFKAIGEADLDDGTEEEKAEEED